MVPGYFGADARFHRGWRNAGPPEELGKLIRADVLVLGHIGERFVHLHVAHFKPIKLGLRDLEPVVDQIADDLLARRGFMGR
ncbi:MAG TPA: hypothetical protein VII39_10145, partial [Bradyrhizobium sp.]